MAAGKGKERAPDRAFLDDDDDEDESLATAPQTRADSEEEDVRMRDVDDDEEEEGEARVGARFDDEDFYSDDDEDDPIVQRYHVYYNPHFIDSLALLQFVDRQPRPHTKHPLLPPCMRSDDEGHFDDEIPEEKRQIKVRYKEKSQYLQLEVPIEPSGPRVWDARSKVLAEGLFDEEAAAAKEGGMKKRGRKSAAEEIEEQERIERLKEDLRIKSIKFESTVVPNTTNYCIASVKDKRSSFRFRASVVLTRTASQVLST